jgi:transposase
VQVDETTVQVLREPEGAATTKSYLWAFRGGDPKRPSLVFQYHPSRSGEVPPEFLLKGYEGVVQSDAYDGYGELGRQPGVVHAGCMAPARRKFVDAARVAKGGGLAADGLEYTRRLYAVRAEARKPQLGSEERQALREREAKSVLKEFKGRLERTTPQRPPKLTLGKAISQALGEWSRLVRYADDGRIEIDNNLVENTSRAVSPSNPTFSVYT